MLTPVAKMGTFALTWEESQWGLPLNGSFNWPSHLCWSPGLLGSASTLVWAGWLVFWVGNLDRVWLARELSQCSSAVLVATATEKVANIMNVNGLGLCKRCGCSDKAVGVKNLDAI
jgi:hypothetical protein